MSEHRVSRQELYGALWSQGNARVAEHYGITFAALVRVCDEFHIPRPGTKYWAAVRLGRKAERAPLASAPVGVAEEVSIVPSTKRTKPGEMAIKGGTDSPQKMAGREPPARRQASVDLKRAHALVRSTREYFKRDALTDPQGRLEPRANRQCLDLTVTRSHGERALRIFDQIIDACLGEGWKVYKPERSYYERNAETLVVIGKEEVRIALIEKSVRRKPTEKEVAEAAGSPYGRRAFFATTGLLRVGVGCMRFESSNVVEETSEAPLDKRIAEVVEALKREAAKQEEMRVRDEERQRAFGEQEHTRLLAQRQKENEAARHGLLEQLAEKWQVSERIRAFVAESEKRLSASMAENPVVSLWNAWARAYADSIDPIQSGLLRKVIGGQPSPG